MLSCFRNKIQFTTWHVLFFSELAGKWLGFFLFYKSNCFSDKALCINTFMCLGRLKGSICLIAVIQGILGCQIGKSFAELLFAVSLYVCFNFLKKTSEFCIIIILHCVLCSTLEPQSWPRAPIVMGIIQTQNKKTFPSSKNVQAK